MSGLPLLLVSACGNVRVQPFGWPSPRPSSSNWYVASGRRRVQDVPKSAETGCAAINSFSHGKGVVAYAVDVDHPCSSSNHSTRSPP